MTNNEKNLLEVGDIVVISEDVAGSSLVHFYPRGRGGAAVPVFESREEIFLNEGLQPTSWKYAGSRGLLVDIFVEPDANYVNSYKWCAVLFSDKLMFLDKKYLSIIKKNSSSERRQ